MLAAVAAAASGYTATKVDSGSPGEASSTFEQENWRFKDGRHGRRLPHGHWPPWPNRRQCLDGVVRRHCRGRGSRTRYTPEHGIEHHKDEDGQKQLMSEP